MRNRVDDPRLPSRTEIEDRLMDTAPPEGPAYCACGRIGVKTCEICESPLCVVCYDAQLERCRSCRGDGADARPSFMAPG